ncbi:PREDICTED: guanine nucleotide-binding protein G(I)/G(S)/G(O) subunit gamma-4 [Myotis davidii]|uniref:guanine nucleotide-binding protein G(I)/G(S)/G(O) subunit gamma-4 n=1 Tax=Myotis davidii TaxID=225400 RepID=UPI0007678BB8|nr:PREDICTED: guanine nucleotide-binding protein G(I)/G(S)/G(O) subunit gamma-4 [Myotis davidii]
MSTRLLGFAPSLSPGGARPRRWLCTQPVPSSAGPLSTRTLGTGPSPCARAVSPQVSQAAADLLAYCEAHAREDPLIIPVPASENPFREKKFFCIIL